jgi:hypothetical protein
MKGKYLVSVFQPPWSSTTNCRVYIDGEDTGFIYTGAGGGTGGTGGLQTVAEVEFQSTSEHTITLKATTPGSLFWDYVQFDPVR